MEIPVISPEGETSPAVSSKSSTSLQDDDALSQLVAKDPELGQVMKIIMGKLDDTNRKLDSLHNDLRRDLDACQDQVSNLDVRVKLMEIDEATPVENIQKELEDKRQQVVEDCLGIPTILRRVLENFCDKELINLSLVNKSWNYEARSVLRDRARLMAMIREGTACRSLLDFASDLQKMRVVPFTGISVSMTHFDLCESFPSGPLNPSYQVILDRLPWKHLSVDFSGFWQEFEDCPKLWLVKSILEEHSGVLEEIELSISNGVPETFEFCQSIFRRHSFPRLKTLRVTRFSLETPIIPDAFVKAMTSSAPSLEKLYMNGRIVFQENVMEGSSAVLVATSGLRPLKEPICESLARALRTETIKVYCPRLWGFDEELLNTCIPMMIQASHSTLKNLWMDLLFAVPLMCYGICLENVTELAIFVTDYTVESTEPDILALVKAFDFTRVFPKLNKVKIWDYHDREFSSNDISAFVERGNAVATEALPDRAINIRHLEIDYENNSRLTLTFLAQMFLHVKILSVRREALQRFPFTLLWEHFGCLAELDIEFDGFYSPIETNLDSVFCGIFHEEVAELRTKDDEYLKAVNIVPVMPSITCMRGLRLLTLWYETRCADHGEDSTRMFSKVTGLIGFPRCPNLNVTFQIPSYSPEVLDHMRPYVTIVVGNPN